VSRWQAERLQIALVPERLALAREGSRRIVEGGLTALPAALRAEGTVRATVVLSNHLVRYVVTPFDPALSGEDEELALARFHFVRIHGERAREWDIRLGGVHGTTRLACAVDGGLIESIRACFPATGAARLVSIQPYLMAGFNRARGLLGKAPGWLALIEHGRACLAFASREGWHAVQSLRLAEERPQDVVDLLEREALRCPAPSPRRALVHGARLRGAQSWSIVQLEEGPYAMALAAA
jgi:hypothetical protein